MATVGSVRLGGQSKFSMLFSLMCLLFPNVLMVIGEMYLHIDFVTVLIIIFRETVPIRYDVWKVAFQNVKALKKCSPCL